MHNQIADSSHSLRCPRQSRTQTVRMLRVFAKRHMIKSLCNRDLLFYLEF